MHLDGVRGLGVGTRANKGVRHLDAGGQGFSGCGGQQGGAQQAQGTKGEGGFHGVLDREKTLFSMSFPNDSF